MIDLLLSSPNKQTAPRVNCARPSARLRQERSARAAQIIFRDPKNRSSDAPPSDPEQLADPPRAYRRFALADLRRDARSAPESTCRRSLDGGRDTAGRRA